MTTPALERPRLSPSERRRRREASLLLPKAGERVVRGEPNRTAPRCAFYKRRSLKTDTSSSLSRQEAPALAEVQRRGGTIDLDRDVFYDDDLSGAGGVYRPGIEALLRAVAAGEYDLIVIWEISRWTRDEREGLLAKKILLDAPCDLASIEEPFVSLYGPTAFFYDWFVAQAAKESQRISARIQDWHAHMTEHGLHRSIAPFGMVKSERPSPFADRVAPVAVLEPDETPRADLGGKSPADLVREAVDDLLAGKSLHAVAVDWNSRDLPSPRGGAWKPQTLRRLLTNPHLAGYLHHKGRILERDGVRVAQLDPVIEPARWQELQDEFKTRSGPAGPRDRRDSLLRGLLRCGRCGSSMVRGNNGGGPSYYCGSKAVGGGTCQGQSIGGDKTDAWVLAAVAELLDDPERYAALLAGGDARRLANVALDEQVASLRAQLDELEDTKATEYADLDGPRRYTRRHKLLTEALDAALMQQRRGEARRPSSVRSMLDDALPVAAALDQLEHHQVATVLSHLIAHVTVQPLRPGQQSRWCAQRLLITWRDEGAGAA